MSTGHPAEGRVVGVAGEHAGERGDQVSEGHRAQTVIAPTTIAIGTSVIGWVRNQSALFHRCAATVLVADPRSAPSWGEVGRQSEVDRCLGERRVAVDETRRFAVSTIALVVG